MFCVPVLLCLASVASVAPERSVSMSGYVLFSWRDKCLDMSGRDAFVPIVPHRM